MKEGTRENSKNSDRNTRAVARADDRLLASDLEGALRRETRDRRKAESVARSQSQAVAKTLELLARSPELPDFINALLRTITTQCGGLWTTFWVLDEQTHEGRRGWFNWRDQELGRVVEAFAGKHPLLMRRLSHLYRDLIRVHGVTMLVPARDPRVPPVVRNFYRKIGANGTLLVPLKLGRRLIGFISHQRAELDIDPAQVAFLEGMAHQAALAFQFAQLSDARHDAECALEEKRLALEQEQELLTINRLLHIAAHNPTDRPGGVLRGSLENTMELLHGHWASLWRQSDVLEFAAPAWIGEPGGCVDVPADAAHEMARRCHAAHRTRFDKWRRTGEMKSESVRSQRLRNLLTAMGAPVAAGRNSHMIHVPLRFDDDSLGFMLILTDRPLHESSERHVAVKALAMQAALALALGEMSAIQRTATLVNERNRIARELHDFLAQSFTGIVLQVEAMRAECTGMPEAVASRLEKIRDQAARSSEELRRTLLMLRPTALDQCTLPEALAKLAHETEMQSGVRVSFRNRAGELQLSPRAEQHLLAMVTESLHNALTHAAPKQISIVFEVVENRLILKIVNDGNPAAPAAAAPRPGHGIGMASLRERAAEIGAQFSFRIRRTNTRVEITAPLERLTVNGDRDKRAIEG
ncbi:MAG: GAF domain-containing sensor histidine kinase [Chthoniobacterales bacterium]